jgi:hypothetical protein
MPELIASNHLFVIHLCIVLHIRAAHAPMAHQSIEFGLATEQQGINQEKQTDSQQIQKRVS